MNREHYRIRSEDGSISEITRTGSELMASGLTIKLAHKYSSDLIYIQPRK